MARGGVYRTEVEKARNALVAEGKHPSVDAIRVALGNTGSKTTIHRHLKEIEAEDAQGAGGKFPISEALADLVGRLGSRLNEEADARIAEAKAAFEAQLHDRTAQLDQQKQEANDLSARLQRTEIALQDETGAHASTRQALIDATTTIRQLEERIAGLTVRVAEHEAHVLSLEEKHRHAREALDHFRTAAKEQREQEQRRHEHQVQELQATLRQASDTSTAKNIELLQLNRDNVRLTEQVGQLDKTLRELSTEARSREREIGELRTLAAEHQALQARRAQDAQSIEQLRTDLENARNELARERDNRQQAESAATRSNERLEVIEELLKKLGKTETAMQPLQTAQNP